MYKIRLLAWPALLISLMVVAGCGGPSTLVPSSNTNDPGSSATGSSVAGSAQLGAIIGADVSIQDGDGNELATAVTDSNGNYGPVDLPESYHGPVIIEISPAGDGSSVYVCDYAGGCPDPGTPGSTIAFGDNVPFTTTLSAALADETSASTANVNPLTTAIRRRAESLGGLTTQNIQQANDEMAAELKRLFNIDATVPIANIPNVDLVNGTADIQDASMLQMGVSLSLVNAGLSALISTQSGLQNLGDVTDALSNGFTAAGKFGTSQNFNTGQVNAGELLYGAEQEIQHVIADQPNVAQAVQQLLPSIDLSATEQQLANTRNSVAPVPPVISGTPPSATQGVPYSFTPTASDPDGDTITFSINITPAWANFDTATGTLSGTPGSSDVGVTHGMVISVSDGTSHVTLAPFDLAVANVNDPPTLTSIPLTLATQGVLYRFTATATDPDAGDTLTFSLSGEPSWLTINPTTGVVSGTPSNADVGTTSDLTLQVTDAAGASAKTTFTLGVQSSNNPPTISGTPLSSVDQGSLYTFTAGASDPDSGDTLIFSLSGAPSWLSVDPLGGVVSGTPGANDVGTTGNITLSVTDAAGATDSMTFSVQVNDINDPPTLSATPPATATQGALYTFTATSTDPDVGDTRVFSLSGAPSWLSVNGGTGVVSGTPTANDVGTTGTITLAVTDSAGASASISFSIQVVNTNDPPTIGGTPPASVDQGSLFSFTPTVNDPDSGDTLTFSLSGAPAWLSVNGTGVVSGTPANGDVGTTGEMTLTVTDSANASASMSFSVQVINVNDAPTISGTPVATIGTGDNYSYTPTASDIDTAVDPNETLTFSLSGNPGWMGVDANTGEVSGTPQAGDVGTTSGIQLIVTDKAGASATLTFSVQVVANNAPTGQVVITGLPAKEGNTLTADASSIADADGLGTFSFQWLRGGVEIPGATGTTYTPATADIGFQLSVQVSYTDGHGLLETVTSDSTDNVIGINTPPSGTPVITLGPTKGFGTVEEGQLLTADTSGISDPDGLGTFHFQWQADGSDVGTDSDTYTIQRADVGKPITVEVSYTDGKGFASSVTSDATAAPVQIVTVQDIFADSVPQNDGPVPQPGQTVYYVDHITGSDRNNGTSLDTAWKTIDQAVNTVGPGDFVYIVGSTDPNSTDAIYKRTIQFGFDIKTPGTPGHVTVYRNYPGTTVIIEGTGARNGIELENASYHHFYGFTIRNFQKSTEGFAPITNLTLENIEFSQTQEVGLRLRFITNLVLRDVYAHNLFETGINMLYCTNVVVERVESAFNSDGKGGDGDGDGFHVEPGENVVFINDYAHDNSEDGFDVQMNGIMYNVVSESHPNASAIKTWRRNNQGSTQPSGGASVPSPFDTELPYAMKRVWVINSRVTGALETGLKEAQGPELNLLYSVVNNNGEEGVAVRSLSNGQLGNGFDENPGTSTVINSILTNNGLPGIVMANSGTHGTIIENHNLLFGNGRGSQVSGISGPDSTDVLADPQFTDESSNDLRVQDTSPAIGAGLGSIDLSADDLGGDAQIPAGMFPDVNTSLLLSIDKFGYKRPASNPDVGYYQHPSQ